MVIKDVFDDSDGIFHFLHRGLVGEPDISLASDELAPAYVFDIQTCHAFVGDGGQRPG